MNQFKQAKHGDIVSVIFNSETVRDANPTDVCVKFRNWFDKLEPIGLFVVEKNPKEYGLLGLGDNDHAGGFTEQEFLYFEIVGSEIHD